MLVIRHHPGRTWRGTSFRKTHKLFPCLERSVEGAAVWRERVEENSDVLFTTLVKPVPWSALEMEITGSGARSSSPLTTVEWRPHPSFQLRRNWGASQQIGAPMGRSPASAPVGTLLPLQLLQLDHLICTISTLLYPVLFSMVCTEGFSTLIDQHKCSYI